MKELNQVLGSRGDEKPKVLVMVKEGKRRGERGVEEEPHKPCEEEEGSRDWRSMKEN